MADKNYVYFINNFDTLYKQFKDKYIVIKNETILGEYASFDEAFNETIETEAIGTFLIQFCSKDENAIGYFYSNNIVFA